MSELERVVLTGSPYERGRAHGERFADAVASNVEIYRQRFAHEGLDLDRVEKQAETYVETIADSNAAYVEEMRGIADGSDVPLRDVSMLNVRWELMYTTWKERAEDEVGADQPTDPPADGCTSFGVTPPATADGKTYIGQNWDWIAAVEETIFLAELRREDAPDVLAMTEAGIVGGKIGVNEHGIGLCVNGLISGTDGENAFRKPYHVRFREVLDAERFDDALRPVMESDRTCSANVVIGHADGEVIDFEAAPGLVNPLYPEGGVLTHANHFETDEVESINEKRSPSTLYRAPRLRRMLAADEGAVSLDTIRAALRDHFSKPESICNHVDESAPEVERGQTNASFVIDLEERRLLGQRGPPCEGEYHEYAL